MADESKPAPAPEPDWADEEPIQLTPAAEAKPEAKPSATPVPAAQAKPAHPRSLVLKARRLGFSEDEINGIDDLATEVAAVEYELAASARERAASSAWRHQPEAAPEPKAAPEPEPEEDPLKALGIDESEWEPKLVAALKKLAGDNAGLKKALAAGETERKTEKAAAAYDAIDDFFESLGDDRFGTGDRYTIKPGAELDRRVALLRAAGIDPKDPPKAKDVAKLLRAAHATLFPAAKAGAAEDAGAYAEAQDAAPEATAAEAARPRGENGRFLSDEEIAERAEEAEMKKRYAASAVAVPTHRSGSPEPKGVKAAKKAFLEGARELAGAQRTSADDLGEW